MSRILFINIRLVFRQSRLSLWVSLWSCERFNALLICSCGAHSKRCLFDMYRWPLLAADPLRVGLNMPAGSADSKLKWANCSSVCMQFSGIESVDFVLVWTLDPSGCVRKDLGKNFARKCLAGMPWLLNSTNFPFRSSMWLVSYRYILYFNFQNSILLHICFLSLVELGC